MFRFRDDAERLRVAQEHAALIRKMLSGEIDADRGLRLSKEMLRPYQKRGGKKQMNPISAPNEHD